MKKLIIITLSILSMQAFTASKVAIISHGWSPDEGPNYPVIELLSNFVTKHGWTPVILDFRKTYGLSKEKQRRTARVLMIAETIKKYAPKASEIVLFGHSQGGAASIATAILHKNLLNSSKVRGVFVLGSESPLQWDELKKPNGELKDPDAALPIFILHPRKDTIIPFYEMKIVSQVWRKNCVLIPSESSKKASPSSSESVSSPGSSSSSEEDCVHHDFLLKEHKEQLKRQVKIFFKYLSEKSSVNNKDSQ